MFQDWRLLAKRLGQCVIAALGTVIVLVFIFYLFRPTFKKVNKNIELRIVATAQRNVNALSNNVRISHIAINGKDIDLSKVSLDSLNSWKYSSKDDFLYSYNMKKKSEISLNIEGVHSLSVTMVQEKGSGVVELWVNNQLWDTIDLYSEVSWGEISVAKHFGIVAFIENHFFRSFFLVWTFILVIWIAIVSINRDFSFIEDHFGVFVRIALSWILGLLCESLTLVLQFRNMDEIADYLSKQVSLFVICAVLLSLSIFTITILTGRIWIGFLTNSIICILLTIISNTKLLNRGVPFFPWDIMLTKEAVSVSSGYDLALGLIDSVCILLVLSITCILVSMHRKEPHVKPVLSVFSFVLMLMICAFVRTNFINESVEDNNVSYRVYQADNYYYHRGVLPAFLEFCSFLDVAEKPDNYSKAELETIENTLLGKEDSLVKTNTPNIIAIMDESFWDATRLDTVDFSEDLMPNFERLQSESVSGELYTHVLSGGTVTSEFEFLTGFSGEFFPQDYMVYGSSLYSGFPSVVNILEKQGYSTLAIHPYLASNYNRENAYEKFGFDKCIFEEDFVCPEMIRGYISDKSTFERVIEEFENGKIERKPQFIFAITMQNHGGYWEEQINPSSEVEFVTDYYGEVAKLCMSDCFAGLHETDRALNELIEYFRNVEEETVIIFFGDHMSDVGPKDDRMFEKTSWNLNDLVYEYETHRVPFLVWSNFENDREDWGTMEIGQLFPSVFDKYNIRSIPFWNFLVSLRSIYSATGNQLLINNDGTYIEISKMTKNQKQAYDRYKLLQYDCIWGEHYASDLWFYDTQ